MLVLLGAITLVGMAVVDNFGYVVRTDTSATDVALTAVAIDTAKAVGATGTYPYLQTMTPCYNATNSTDILTSDMYVVAEGDKNGGSFTLQTAGLAYNATNINCTISYLEDSTGSDSATSFITGLTVFATFSSVIALAIIGMLVINIFKKDGY